MQVFLQKQKIPEKSQKEICEDFGRQEKASLATLDKAHHVGQVNHMSAMHLWANWPS